MDHINSIRAALRAKAPVVAVPVDGHAPVCVRAKLLKGALKGVTIDSVEVCPNRWLTIKGHAGFVHTCSKFAPMDRNTALRMIGDWSDRERKKRKVIALQGVLSAKEQRALKLKRAEQAGIAELIDARKQEAQILAEAKRHTGLVLTPVSPRERESIIADYAAFRAQRANRKRGSVIRWKLAKLREQVAAMTKQQCEYEEKGYTVSPYARRRKVLKRKVTVLRKQNEKVLYAARLYQIGQLKKQYKALYPPVFRDMSHLEMEGWYVDPWIPERPKDLPYTVPWEWRYRENQDKQNEKTAFSRLVNIANRLKHVRADIRALTPPADEETGLQIAA
jgi:hypothetical protein